MPYIKNALLRYRVIDRCLRNRFNPFPSKLALREACEEALYGTSQGTNICDSTIEKDIFSMRMDHDAPIKFSKSKGGYYYTDPNYTINQIPLTEEDLTSIKFALNTLTQFRETQMFKQFGSAIDKIINRVTISGNPEDDEVNNFVQFETNLSQGGSDLLPVLLKAIQNSHPVNFKYTSFISPEAKERKVAPLLLKEYRNRWYLIAFDLRKSKTLTFGLDRMSEFKVNEEDHVGKPLDFNPENFFKYACGITVLEAEPETVILKANNVASRYIESQPFHLSQKITKKGKNKTTFQLKIWISEEFIRAVLSYGNEIEVVQPISLKNTILERAKAIVDSY